KRVPNAPSEAVDGRAPGEEGAEGFGDLGHGALPQRAECGPKFGREQLGLFPGGKVATLVHRVVVDVDVGVGPLDPAPRSPPDLAGERGESDRNRDGRGSLARRARALLSVLAVRACRGRAGT